MMIHDITKMVGKHKRRKRIGCGVGSGHGKTSGRGTKGSGSRSGYGGSIPAMFESGQRPYFMRLPKLGFSNALFTKRFVVVNLKAIDSAFDAGADVTPQALVKAGLIHDTKTPVKVLGDGELKKKGLKITAAKFSAKAKEKIAAAGGSCTEA
jgi:large subunit ribosomal protein L15